MEINGDLVWITEDHNDPADKITHWYRDDVYPLTFRIDERIGEPPSPIKETLGSSKEFNPYWFYYEREMRQIRRQGLKVGEIEKGIPLWPRYRPEIKGKWNFLENMEIGDSVRVDLDLGEDIKQLVNSFSMGKKRFGKMAFSYRKGDNDDHIRIWRTE